MFDRLRHAIVLVFFLCTSGTLFHYEVCFMLRTFVDSTVKLFRSFARPVVLNGSATKQYLPPNSMERTHPSWCAEGTPFVTIFCCISVFQYNFSVFQYYFLFFITTLFNGYFHFSEFIC